VILLQLFFEYFKVGLFAVGGGLATLPFLYAMSDSTGWFTHTQLADMLAVSESTPGPIGVNMATYVGFTTAGIPGTIAATLGLVTPSVIIIIVVAHFLKAFSGNPLVQGAFYGLRPASVGLIAAAGWVVLKISLLDIPLFRESGELLRLFRWKGLVLALVIFAILKLWKIHPVFVIALSAVVGAVFRFAEA
jgi:chromate transporter